MFECQLGGLKFRILFGLNETWFASSDFSLFESPCKEIKLSSSFEILFSSAILELSSWISFITSTDNWFARLGFFLFGRFSIKLEKI